MSCRWILCFLGLVAMPLCAADPERAIRQPSWRWTMDERLALRLDTLDMREREPAYGHRIPGKYVIEGARDPQLFFPTELFDAYLWRFVDPRGVWPRPDARFPAIERIASRWIASYRKQPFSDETCRQLALALAMARAEYGADAFDRFLYETVAPQLTMTYERSSEEAARLRSHERGCREH